MNVRNIMTEPAFTCRVKDTLQDAADLMRERNVGAIVVLSDDGRSEAVVTDRDICFAAADLRRSLEDIEVQAARSSAAITCGPDDPLDQALSEMQTTQVRRLVVVDPVGRPMGMLSLDDIAVEALRELERGDDPPAVSAEAVVRTYGEAARAAAQGHLPIPPDADAMPRPSA